VSGGLPGLGVERGEHFSEGFVKARHTLCFKREADVVHVYADRAESSHRVLSLLDIHVDGPNQGPVIIEQAIVASGSVLTRVRADQALDVAGVGIAQRGGVRGGEAG
jgi:hypothetical protein